MEESTASEGNAFNLEFDSSRMNRKILVAYFSASGETRHLAKTLSKAIEADLYEIEADPAYSTADLDWTNKRSRSSLEHADPGIRPRIAKPLDDMDAYDAVLVGYPIWWGDAPNIIRTFLESYDFSGKTVVTFATSGGSVSGSDGSKLHGCCSDETSWKKGRLWSPNAKAEELREWVESLGL